MQIIQTYYRPGFEVDPDNQVEDHSQENGQQTLKHLVLSVEPARCMIMSVYVYIHN